MWKRRWPVPLALLLVVLLGAAWFAPERRLRREMEAARREGLWLDDGDVRASLAPRLGQANAWKAIRKLCGLGFPEKGYVVDLAWNEAEMESPRWLAGRSGTPMPADLRRALDLSAEKLAGWRAVANMAVYWKDPSREKNDPNLAFEELWGFSCDALVAAGTTGPRGRESLLAAARIAALVGQDPTFESQAFRAELGLKALRIARTVGMEGPVAEALGSPIDVRRLLLASLPERLRAIDEDRRLLLRSPRWLDRLQILVTPGGMAKIRTIQAYRAMMRRLPSDPVAAAPLIESEFDRLETLAESQSLGGSPTRVFVLTPVPSIKDLSRLEVERRAALATFYGNQMKT